MSKINLCDDMHCIHYHINEPIPSGILTHEELNIFMILFHKIHAALETSNSKNKINTRQEDKRSNRTAESELNEKNLRFKEGIDYVKPKRKLTCFESDKESIINNENSKGDDFFEQGMILEKKSCKPKIYVSNSFKSDKLPANFPINRSNLTALHSWSLVELPNEQAVAVEGFIRFI